MQQKIPSKAFKFFHPSAVCIFITTNSLNLHNNFKRFFYIWSKFGKIEKEHSQRKRQLALVALDDDKYEGV